MATASPPQPSAPREKFSIDKSVHGGVTYLAMSGTLNVDFIGRKVAKLVKTRRLVVNMREVRRFASWGMSEWMDFLRITADDDVFQFLRTTLHYDITPDVNQFRARRAVKNRYTYLRLSGNLSALPSDVLVRSSEGTTVVDLTGVLADGTDLRPWHNYITGAM